MSIVTSPGHCHSESAANRNGELFDDMCRWFNSHGNRHSRDRVPYTYVWTVPTGVTNPGNVASFTTTVAGTYSVVITDATSTCPSLPAQGTVTVNPQPTVTVNSSTICADGSTATVTATPGTAGTYTYVWTVPTGVTNPGNVASFTTTVAGTYSVVITDATSTCPSLPAQGTVTVNPQPTVTVNSSTICADGSTASVTATPGTAGTYTYVWTVPAGVTNPGNVASFHDIRGRHLQCGDHGCNEHMSIVTSPGHCHSESAANRNGELFDDMCRWFNSHGNRHSRHSGYLHLCMDGTNRGDQSG